MGFTNSSSNTFPPSPSQPLYKIWRDWCIGDSLGYLNDNFLYLETLVNTLSTYTTTLSSLITQAPYVAKAFVQFTGIGTAAIVKSYNVSNVTRISTGVYQINFTTPFSTSSYLALGNNWFSSGSSPGSNNVVYFQAATTSSIRAVNWEANLGGSGAFEDAERLSVVLFDS